MDQASRGAAALSAGNYIDAVAEYSSAISSQPQAVSYYIRRSTAYQRKNPPELDLALQDAETAVALAYKRAKRELIAEAQLRRTIALFALGKYESAKSALEYVKKYNEKEKSLPIWTRKIEDKLKSVEVTGDAILREHRIKEIPDVIVKDDISKLEKGSGNIPKPGLVASSQTLPRGENLRTPANKIRHDWYQNSEKIYITVLAKGIPKDKASIDINELSVTVSFPTIDSVNYELSLDPLFAPIDVSKSSSQILGTKVEVILQKTILGQKWKSLEGMVPPQSSTNTGLIDGESVNSTETSFNKPMPAYPTSSRTGPKDWDKVAAELTQKPKANTEGENEAEDIEEEGGDPVNAFFKKLYASADPDTRRAMVKSYQESNGTALSTNWSDVSKGCVETSPPDGMVAKKWNN